MAQLNLAVFQITSESFGHTAAAKTNNENDKKEGKHQEYEVIFVRRI